MRVGAPRGRKIKTERMKHGVDNWRRKRRSDNFLGDGRSSNRSAKAAHAARPFKRRLTLCGSAFG